MTTLFVCAIGLCVVFLLYMVYEAHQNNIVHLNIRLPNLPEPFIGYKIYFISDIHRRKVSKKMLAKVAQPDIVIIGGDLTEKGVPFSRVEENLMKLKSLNAPVLFVWGNHDLQVDRGVLGGLFQKHRIIPLVNESHIVERAGRMLNFIGVDDATNYRDDLDLAIKTTKPGYRILISHNPLISQRVQKHHGIPLVLCGHTHGGQIRLLGWGMRESGGIKETPYGKLVISKGYGTTHFHLRLGAKPDTLYITLDQSGI
ncbi:MAG: metallophosphoesterase [Tuberibacillus sp.]